MFWDINRNDTELCVSHKINNDWLSIVCFILLTTYHPQTSQASVLVFELIKSISDAYSEVYFKYVEYIIQVTCDTVYTCICMSCFHLERRSCLGNKL